VDGKTVIFVPGIQNMIDKIIWGENSQKFLDKIGIKDKKRL
jgi:hypothetical protein